jgi:hypothetical protein
MTIDELMKENADVLQRMKEEDDRFDARRLAHEWWNWDITPPAGYAHAVSEYIAKHPEEFKGAGPQ